MIKANEIMTTWLVELIGAYAGPLDKGLEKILEEGLVQVGEFVFLAEPRKEKIGETPIPKAGKSAFERLVNEIDIAKHLGKSVPPQVLSQGLTFTYSLRKKLAPLGSFQISLSWAFNQECIVTFHKIRDNETGNLLGPRAPVGYAILEIST